MTPLDNPITIQFGGKTRDRLLDLNYDFGSAKSDHIVNSFERRANHIVIESVEEANAVAYELDHLRHEGKRDGRTWMNGSAAKACGRRADKIVAAMEQRGFETDRRFNTVHAFVEPGDLDDDADDQADEGEGVLADGGVAPPEHVDGDTVYAVAQDFGVQPGAVKASLRHRPCGSPEECHTRPDEAALEARRRCVDGREIERVEVSVVADVVALDEGSARDQLEDFVVDSLGGRGGRFDIKGAWVEE